VFKPAIPPQLSASFFFPSQIQEKQRKNNC